MKGRFAAAALAVVAALHADDFGPDLAPPATKQQADLAALEAQTAGGACACASALSRRAGWNGEDGDDCCPDDDLLNVALWAPVFLRASKVTTPECPSCKEEMVLRTKF